jgi:hypothetical protein
MAWNGSGAVTLLYDWTADRDAGPPDSYISADKFDLYGEDLAATIEATLNRNGENAIAANISWDSNKITDLGNATAAADATNMQSVGPALWAGTSAGSSNAYTVTANITTVIAGSRITFVPSFTNTGASTVAVNGGSATAIVRLDGTALSANDIRQDWLCDIVYTGTAWKLLDITKQELDTDYQASGSYQPLDDQLTDIAATTPTKGNLIVGNGSNYATQAVGTDTFVLTADTASGTGLAWQAQNIPAGTHMLVYAASAPTGWTGQDTGTDHSIRVVSATSLNGGVLGGTTNFSSVFAARTITQANLPNVNLTAASNGAHQHLLWNGVTGSGTEALTSGNYPKFDTDVSSNSSNYTIRAGGLNIPDRGLSQSNGAHTHTVPLGGSGTALDFAVKYMNWISCTKDAY